MPDDVLTWLNGNRNFFDGLTLLQQYGATKFILDLLSTGPSAFNTPKLLKELQKIPAPAITAGPVAAAPAARPKPAPERPASSIYKPDHNLEKQLRIKAQIKTLYKEINHQHAKLSVLPEGDELYRCALDVVTKQLRKQDLWQHLHYFEQNGKWFDELPENQVEEFDPNDPEQLERKIKNLMASRSKVTKDLKKPWPKAQEDHLKRRQADFTKKIEYYISLRKKDA